MLFIWVFHSYAVLIKKKSMLKILSSVMKQDILAHIRNAHIVFNCWFKDMYSNYRSSCGQGIAVFYKANAFKASCDHWSKACSLTHTHSELKNEKRSTQSVLLHCACCGSALWKMTELVQELCLKCLSNQFIRKDVQWICNFSVFLTIFMVQSR